MCLTPFLRSVVGLLLLVANTVHAFQNQSIHQQWQVDAGYNWRNDHLVLRDEDRLSIRYNLDYGLRNGRLMAQYQMGYLYSERSTDNTKYRYRVADLDSHIIESDVSQNLDRLSLQYYFAHADMTLGRQAISLGNARFSSNVDVFYPKLLGALQTDYRAGVDAIRFEHMLALDSRGLSLVDGAWLGQRQSYLRFRTNIKQVDSHLTHVRLKQDQATSLALDGAMDSTGWWMIINALQNSDRNSELITAQLGFDFSWQDYLYQIEWSQRQAKHIQALSSFIENGMLPFADERYAFASATYLSGVRSQFQLSLAHNVIANSQLWSLVYQYSIDDVWDAWLQINTNDGLYQPSDESLFSFQSMGHLISINAKAVF